MHILMLSILALIMRAFRRFWQAAARNSMCIHTYVRTCMSRSCCELENRVCRNKLRFSTYPGRQIRQLLKGFQVSNYPSRWFRGTLVGIWGRYVICF